jgi:hypothetical protein
MICVFYVLLGFVLWLPALSGLDGLVRPIRSLGAIGSPNPVPVSAESNSVPKQQDAGIAPKAFGADNAVAANTVDVSKNNATPVNASLPITPNPIASSSASISVEAKSPAISQAAPASNVTDAPVNLDKELSADVEGIDFDENVFAQISSGAAKLDAVAAKAKTVVGDLDVQYKKADSDMAAFVADVDKKMDMFDHFYRELKAYVASQQSLDDKAVKEQVLFLSNDLRDFAQDFSAVGSLRKDLELAQKDVVMQNSDKTAALFKIYSLQNEAAAIKAEFLAVKPKDKEKMGNDLKKLDDLDNDANRQLASLQTISSAFKGKIEIVSGKMEQIKNTQKSLDPKKEALEKKLNDILRLKEKSATDKEAELLSKIASTVRGRPARKGGLPEVLTNQAVDYSSGDTYAVAIDEKEVVRSFTQKVIVGMNDFFEKAFIFGKKFIAALRLEQSIEKDATLVTTTSTTSLVSGVVPEPPVALGGAPKPALTPTMSLTLSTSIVAGPTSLASAQSTSLSLTPTITASSAPLGGPEAAQKETTYVKDLLAALADILSGYKKILFVFWDYVTAVYGHLRK